MTLRNWKTSTVSVLAVGALALSACGNQNESAGGDNDGAAATSLRIGSLMDISSWDPAQANLGHLVPLYQASYDTLLKREPDGEVTPMLATSWEYGEDNLSFTMELRDDVDFTDGEHFDAEAVKTNIEHFQQANGPMMASLTAVESVEVVDDYTVTLNLSEPNPSLPNIFTSAGGFMGSPAALDDPEIQTMPVGSGPFIMDEARSVAGSQVVFQRNEDYWGEELPFDSLEFQMLEDETARFNALQSDQVDAGVFQQVENVSELESSGFLSDPFSINWQGVIIFDRDGEMVSELGDVRVREALALALDGEALLEVVQQGRGEETNQTFGTETSGYKEELDDVWGYDPERAEELLAEAGAEDLELPLPYSPGIMSPSLTDAIQQNWEEVGITISRHEWGPNEAIPSMLRGDFPLAWMSLAQRDSWRHIDFMMTPGSSWNPLGTERDDLNELIEHAQYAETDEELGEAAQEINQYMVDDVWFIPTYRPEDFFYWSDQWEVENQVEQAVPSIYNYTPDS